MMYEIKNRSASVVVYKIPEDGIRREFAPGEVKRVSMEELEKLTFQAGGRNLLANFLQVIGNDAVEELNIPAEEEYYMSEQDVIDVLKSGSLEQFLDCLDFAPIGVIDLIKTYAVALPLTDLNKIEALKEKTGFDTAAALRNAAAEKATEEEVKEEAPAKKTTTGRRTSVSYNKTATTSTAKTVKKVEKSE